MGRYVVASATRGYTAYMPTRVQDWLRQAEHDLEVARTTRQAGQFDWACFAAQQAAEKAIKALFESLYAERLTNVLHEVMGPAVRKAKFEPWSWGNAVHTLIERLVVDEPGLGNFLEAAKVLDKFYIRTRYPNGLEKGAPADAYTPTEADLAIGHATKFVEFCQARCRTA
jgi:HEPN domain-containing protein